MIKLAVTGGIGSGKSFVCALLMQRGIPVYDCDEWAKVVMKDHPDVRIDLVALLGSEVYKEDGSLNVPLLSSYLFASSQHTSTINHIVHPRLKQHFLTWVSGMFHKTEIVAMESAILFEAGFDDAVDVILTVDAPLDVKIDRVMKRNNVTREKVLERMAAQLPDTEKCLRADFILTNDGRESIDNQLDKLLDCLLKGKKCDKQLRCSKI